MPGQAFAIFIVVITFCLNRKTLSATLVVAPYSQSTETAQEVKFECSTDETNVTLKKVVWSYGNISLAESDSSQRVRVISGTLIISNVSFADAGTYTCSDYSGSENQTGVLTVYTMPSYVVEGIIIASISVALLLVMLVGICAFRWKTRGKTTTRKTVGKENKSKLDANGHTVGSSFSTARYSTPHSFDNFHS